ncbi:hypothetical protein ABK040_000476 [Willaertia magna]
MASLLFETKRIFSKAQYHLNAAQFSENDAPLGILFSTYQLNRQELTNTIRICNETIEKHQTNVIGTILLILLIIGFLTCGISLIITFPIIIILVVIQQQQVQQNVQKAKLELEQFIRQENERVYLPKGLEVVIKTDNMFILDGNGRPLQQLVFIFQMYAINGGNTTFVIQQPIQQPFYQQQQSPMYYQSNNVMNNVPPTTTSMVVPPNQQENAPLLQQQSVENYSKV